MRYFILVLLFITSAHGEFVGTVDAKNSTNQEQRYYALIDEIRCPVCQGQSIGGSNASLAKDLRVKVKELILAQKSDDDIRRFMTDRYGDFVVFKPPVNKNTIFLWLAPFVFLGLAIFLFMRTFKHKKPVVSVDTSEAKDLLK